MQIEPNRLRPAYLAAVALLACVPMLRAQSTVAASSQPATVATLDGSQPLDLTVDLAHRAGVDYSSSSAAATETIDPAAAGSLHFAGLTSDATQPPPRRRYGRPRYNDNSHNADGSSKYGFIAGAGLTATVGNTHKYLNTDYSFQVGAGRNFNQNFSLLAQFDWDAFGFNGLTLSRQSYRFFQQQGTGLDGKSHIWSFSLNPVYNFRAKEGLGAYVVGGVGFYHKTATFTLPTTLVYCDIFGFCQQYQANQTFPGGKYASNAVGFNGGLGLTYKPSRFSSQRLYVEARYVYVANQKRFGITDATAPTYTGNNYYPENSNRTTYIPIKAGIRF